MSKISNFSQEEKFYLQPFFSNLDHSVYVPFIFSPELIGALCSRTSRAKDDLRKIFLDEFLKPFLKPTKGPEDTNLSWSKKLEQARKLLKYIEFLHENPIENLFFNAKARSFYLKWLAQYGDDSIAQMAGAHLVFSGISQVAIKHLEDQRIGLAPIEKSTRYVDYSQKVNGAYLYYTDPILKKINLHSRYQKIMDKLFDTYTKLTRRYIEILTKTYPKEPINTLKTKALDTLRGLLPTSTLSQVAFFANGQAFEYLINRCAKHKLQEIRWIAQRAKEELNTIIPAFLRRLDQTESQDYQEYLAQKSERIKKILAKLKYPNHIYKETKIKIKLIEYEKDGENKVITGLIFPETHETWQTIYKKVNKMTPYQKQKILETILKSRKFRWYKVPRAFENCYVRFEITMDIGAWRDLHRHRLKTQQRQKFSCYHGYNMPPELKANKLDKDFKEAVKNIEELFSNLEKFSPDIAQYAVCLCHRIRFTELQNLRAFVWQNELRTIPEGHPNYRKIEQEKFRLIQKAYPLLSKYIKVNKQDYLFARRGTNKKITARQRELIRLIK